MITKNKWLPVIVASSIIMVAGCKQEAAAPASNAITLDMEIPVSMTGGGAVAPVNKLSMAKAGAQPLSAHLL